MKLFLSDDILDVFFEKVCDKEQQKSVLQQNEAKQHSQLRTAVFPIILNTEGIMWEGRRNY